MARTLRQTAQGAADQAQEGAADGSQKWDAMTEEQKKQTFDKPPADQKKGKSYSEWGSEGYHDQYVNWTPSIEDMYLKSFTKDNKASYAIKDTLDKTKIIRVEQVDTLQGDVNNLVGNQFGKSGILQPGGHTVSEEGINRAERGSKISSAVY
ncbi:hypothetical protein LTR78_010108 [Recurvomyces mirabilis]|uniref:Uncharacterized protein n=1 Tax=Recurvomyces mirabilis TaxID=574656 RepID=A0AAE0TNG9_9PEZI|nr:hypothetical protein LTR78_010108 [Recurvomyces mirabilis]